MVLQSCELWPEDKTMSLNLVTKQPVKQTQRLKELLRVGYVCHIPHSATTPYQILFQKMGNADRFELTVDRTKKMPL
jgi:hypothetical protein